jgi:acyl-CoA synthetase (AMP-forming)/AMP-acid ligase II
MHHNLGLVGLLLAPLAVGATSVLMSPTEFLKHPQRWLQLIDTFDIRLTAAPNFAYDHCVRRISPELAGSFDLSRLRTAVNGPEPVSAATLTAFAERFAPAGLNPRALTPAYGPADRLITVSPPGDRIDGPLITPIDRWALERDTLQPAAGGLELVSCGPVEGTGLQVFNPATQTELLDGLVGEIWLDGYAPTGDLGVIHGGQLYRTGRVSDRLVIDERSLYAQDIEQELAQLDPAFADLPGCVCAVDVPREELVVLQEVPARTSSADLIALSSVVRDALRDRYRVRVANVVFLRPGQIHRVAGRVQRTLMRELFRSDALAPVYEVLGRQTRQRFRFTEPLPTLAAPAKATRRRNAAVSAVAAK